MSVATATSGVSVEPGLPGRDRPLDIVLVHTSDQGGGAEASTLSLHRALQQLGHRSRMYVGTKKGDDPDVHQIERFRCLPGVLWTAKKLEERFGWQYLYHPWFRRLDKLVGATTDVVHYHSLWSGRYGYADVGALPRLTRKFPSVMTLRDLWMLTGHCGCPAIGCERWRTGCGQCPDLALAPAISRDGTRFNFARKRAAMQRSRVRVIAVSQWLADQTRESPIFRGMPLHVVYNGIDESAFFPRPQAEMRTKLGLPQDALIVLMAGQSIEGTGGAALGATDCALQALANCEYDVFPLLIGHSAEKVLARWGRPGKAIPFLKVPSQLAEYYAAADLTLVASLWETFGRIPAESQMCGTPVVGFATGGIPEVVAHGETGLLAERLNTQALTAALRAMLVDADVRRRMGLAGAERACRLFSTASYASSYVEHYQAVIEERAARR